MALIEAINVTKTYAQGGSATRALQDVSLAVEEGEFLAVMGPSGSGKSTLLHILGLLDRPSSGSVRFQGHDTRDTSDEELATTRNERIGFVFQAFHLLPRASVLENVLLPLHYSKVPTDDRPKRAREAIARVGLAHRMQYTPAQLSGGERQRVAIARALVNEPTVIFADEPTGNLDSATGRTVLGTLDTLHRQGRTIVLITHEMPAAQYAQRTLHIRDGRLVTAPP